MTLHVTLLDKSQVVSLSQNTMDSIVRVQPRNHRV